MTSNPRPWHWTWLFPWTEVTWPRLSSIKAKAKDSKGQGDWQKRKPKLTMITQFTCTVNTWQTTMTPKVCPIYRFAFSKLIIDTELLHYPVILHQHVFSDVNKDVGHKAKAKNLDLGLYHGDKDVCFVFWRIYFAVPLSALVRNINVGCFFSNHWHEICTAQKQDRVTFSNNNYTPLSLSYLFQLVSPVRHSSSLLSPTTFILSSSPGSKLTTVVVFLTFTNRFYGF